jgi:hypothetical protein
MLVDSVPDLKFQSCRSALLITFHDHVADLGEHVFSGDLETGVRLSSWVFDEATRGPDVKVIRSRFGLVLGREMRLVRRMSGARRTAFIVPPSEIVTSAQSFWSLAYADIQRWRAGSLMSIRPRMI